MKKTNNPHLNLLNINYEIYLQNTIKSRFKDTKDKISILDIGGGSRADCKKLFDNYNISYNVLDLEIRNVVEGINYIKGDITDVNLKLDNTYDVIITKDTFEHILNPWDATKNIIDNLKENGIFIFLAPFSWRYHAYPYDTFRYTHVGAQYLFERLGKLKKIESGYYYSSFETSGRFKNNKDRTLDNKPYKNCIECIYIAKKDSNHKFNIKDLDVNKEG